MKLYINTGNSEKVIVGLDGKKIEKDAQDKKSQILLQLIEDEMRKHGKETKDITEVEVFLGPGSFTGLKVGVSVANALGWTLGIPVNGKNVRKEGPLKPVYE